jgi:hypothetical protein
VKKENIDIGNNKERQPEIEKKKRAYQSFVVEKSFGPSGSSLNRAFAKAASPDATASKTR